ncbi:Fic family protein [Holdemanella biformis]|nr:Fic family protein [Holdemanella biformis]MEE0666902.1 Fic family protein [Holdemanella biformis]
MSFEDIVEFHVCFERIHPFGDGNGRTGRMIMLNNVYRIVIFHLYY